jgi:hypothetical protein
MTRILRARHFPRGRHEGPDQQGLAINLSQALAVVGALTVFSFSMEA